MPKPDRVVLGIFLLAAFLTASRNARADGLTSTCATYECGFLDNSGAFSNNFIPGPAANSARGINDAGDIVGDYSNGGFFYTGPTYTPIDYPGATQTFANGINDSGEIVGTYCTFAGTCNGYVDNGGTFTSISVPGASGALATGISNSGQIVGYYCVPGSCAGFVDSGGTITTINDPGASSTYLYGINDSGQIIGSAESPGVGQGFVYQAGSFTTLSFTPNGINDEGVIVGDEISGADPPGVVDQGSTLSEFSVPGSVATDAIGINNNGEMVGWYIPSQTAPLPEPGTLALLATGLIVLAGLAYRRRWLSNV
jgi:uncharacterized membrane protein